MHWSLLPATDFARHEAAWNRLNAAVGDAPFLQGGFIAPLLAAFPDENVRLAVGSGDGEVIAMALVTRKGRFAWETWQPSQLPLGPWVMRPGEDIGRLGARLLRALPGCALVLGITQLDPLFVPRPAAAAGLATLDYIETGSIAIEGTFDTYWEARGKNLRTNMRKQRKKLDADGMAATLAAVTDRMAMADAVAGYGALESAGWKAALGTAIHPENAQGRFYRAMLENFAAADAARVYRYRFGDHDVAIDLCIASPTMLVVLKTTYDESIRTLSPASLMREEAMRAIFGEARVPRVEFYGKMMDWHTHWTKDTRTLYHLSCYRWPWLERARQWRRQSRPSAA
jgi:CelD/BcsL family acetyltransferase involved in cellulose biosynthesis